MSKTLFILLSFIILVIVSIANANASIYFSINNGVAIVPKVSLNLTNKEKVNVDANNGHFLGAVSANLLIDLFDISKINQDLKLVLSATYYYPKLKANAASNEIKYSSKIFNTYISAGLSYKIFEHSNTKYYLEAGFNAGRLDMTGTYRLKNQEVNKINIHERYVSPYFGASVDYKLNDCFNIGMKGTVNIVPKQIIRKDDNITLTTNKNGLYYTNILFYVSVKVL